MLHTINWIIFLTILGSGSLTAHCPRLGEIGNGQVNQPDRIEVGSIATYSCKLGFRVYRGEVNRTCQSNGEWSGVNVTCLKACNYDSITL